MEVLKLHMMRMHLLLLENLVNNLVLDVAKPLTSDQTKLILELLCRLRRNVVDNAEQYKFDKNSYNSRLYLDFAEYVKGQVG